LYFNEGFILPFSKIYTAMKVPKNYGNKEIFRDLLNIEKEYV